MVDLSFIKKRKKKKIIAIVGLICGMGVATVSAVALLGQQAAPMTVRLANSGVSLALYKSEFDNEQKSFLLASDAKPYSEISEPALHAYESMLDIDDSKPIETSDGKAFQFYQFTFYLKNTGEVAADYTFILNVSYPRKTSFDFAEVLRVRFYENDGNDKESHNYQTFAKHSNEYDSNKQQYLPERISGVDSEYAEDFVDSKTILKKEVKSFKPSALTRYSLVMWIEGEDKQAVGKAPLDSGIALGVDISAHETEETPLE